jgi:hypothetical protein
VSLVAFFIIRRRNINMRQNALLQTAANTRA